MTIDGDEFEVVEEFVYLGSLATAAEKFGGASSPVVVPVEFHFTARESPRTATPLNRPLARDTDRS